MYLLISYYFNLRFYAGIGCQPGRFGYRRNTTNTLQPAMAITHKDPTFNYKLKRNSTEKKPAVQIMAL